MPFAIVRSDITKMEVDAIVNATNQSLISDGGVSGAIFAAANSEKLIKECEKIAPIDIGTSVITKGYNLSAKYIIHTVGPVYGNSVSIQEKQLYSCYDNSLKLAKKKRLKSIAFPLISSGTFGYPKAEALRIATSAIRDFLAENEMEVFLVVYDKEAFEISNALFDRVRSYIDEASVRTERSARFNAPEKTAYPSCPYDVNFDAVAMPEAKYSLDEDRASVPFVKSRQTRCLEDLFDKKIETFSQMLLRLIDEKGMTDVEVYKRANIDRKLFSKIRGKNYTPRKHTVIALAIALRLNLDETKDLLRRAGFALSECDRFDVIIEYFLENEEYDIFEINKTLFYFDQQLLGV